MMNSPAFFPDTLSRLDWFHTVGALTMALLVCLKPNSPGFWVEMPPMYPGVATCQLMLLGIEAPMGEATTDRVKLVEELILSLVLLMAEVG